MRVERLLDRIRRPVARAQVSRSLAVLEFMATQEAKELLRELAGGTPEASLTREAKEALTRVRNRER